MSKDSTKGRVRGRAKKSHTVKVERPAGARKDEDAPLPVDVVVELDSQGQVRSVQSGQPNPEDVDEVRHYLETLETHGRVARHGGPLKPGETHREETDEEGHTQVVRKRFSAI